MRYTCCAIHLCCAVLVEAMEVKACGLILQTVLDIHDHAVAYICGYRRYRPLTVDANSLALESAVGIRNDPANVEIIGDSGSFGNIVEKKKRSGQTHFDGRKHSESYHVETDCLGTWYLKVFRPSPEL